VCLCYRLSIIPFFHSSPGSDPCQVGKTRRAARSSPTGCHTYLGAFLRNLCKLGMCVIVANTMERCSLFLPLRWGAGPMALMLWLHLVI
jgi:hypothetical protein